MHILVYLAIEEACKPLGQGQQEDATLLPGRSRKEVVLSESRSWKHSMGWRCGAFVS